MTEQITIKLNKEKFGPILSYLREYGAGMFTSNSAMAAYCIWFVQHYVTKKIPGAKKTRFDLLLEARNITKQECMFETLAEYRKFCEQK